MTSAMLQPQIGVLALQGAFTKHIIALESLGVAVHEVRTIDDLKRCQGLIIPGGESTTMAKLITHGKLWDPIRDFAKQYPVFGTCAGMILMAKDVIGRYDYPTLGLMDTTVLRNAYGKQLDSFATDLTLNLPDEVPCIGKALFIRAPQIESWASKVRVLASYEDKPVLLQQGIHLCASYHPELTDSRVIHAYFLKLAQHQLSAIAKYTL